jgi:hypothetical protein
MQFARGVAQAPHYRLMMRNYPQKLTRPDGEIRDAWPRADEGER